MDLSISILLFKTSSTIPHNPLLLSGNISIYKSNGHSVIKNASFPKPFPFTPYFIVFFSFVYKSISNITGAFTGIPFANVIFIDKSIFLLSNSIHEWSNRKLDFCTSPIQIIGSNPISFNATYKTLVEA